MIQVDRLTKYYGDVCAIRDISFRIGKGEVVGLLGLNGAGKTTTLRILSCLLLPTSGTVKLDGIDVVEDPHAVRTRIGFVPESPPLYDEMTVRDYLAFTGRIRGLSGQRLQTRLNEVETSLALQSVSHKLCGVLSHGYRRRVAIGQAIIHDPAVLILDDPILGLDPVQIVEMRSLIRSLRGKHTLVLSSHILPEIEQTCDRIFVIHAGKLVAEGTEDELGRRFATGHKLEVEVRSRTTGDGDEHPYRDDAPATAKLAVDTLSALPGVTAARQVEARGEVRLELDAIRDVRAAVARAIIDAGLDLVGLRRHEAELEAIFVQATRDDIQPASTSPAVPGAEVTP